MQSPERRNRTRATAEGTRRPARAPRARSRSMDDKIAEKLRAPEVMVKDFQQVLKHSFSSVSKEELKRYDDWTTQFGQEGA